MHIKISDKYYLNSDPQCYWVTQEVKIATGKHAGEMMEKRVSGYYAKLPDLMENFIDSKLRRSNASTLDELWDVVDDIADITEGALKVLTELDGKQ